MEYVIRGQLKACDGLGCFFEISCNKNLYTCKLYSCFQNRQQITLQDFNWDTEQVGSAVDVDDPFLWLWTIQNY